MAGAWLVRQCERCGFAVKDRELHLTQRHFGNDRRLHIGCLVGTELSTLYRSTSGVRCIFCGMGSMTLAMLIDHFNRFHGRVIANW